MIQYTQFNALKQLNAALATPTIFDQNQQWINRFYFNMLEDKLDSLSISEPDWLAIKTLAFTCPYIGGSAVYKARVLWGIEHPATHYDEIVICNSQGVYKGSNKLQEQINQLIAAQHRSQLEDKGLLLYPNPSQDKITIESLALMDASATVYIIDMLGNIVKKVALPAGIQKQVLDIKDLAQGVYMCEFFQFGKASLVQKLIKNN
ncbi:MAG: T9SS type A sorting domain-containing protein [Chitinophagaceae bacterium]